MTTNVRSPDPLIVPEPKLEDLFKRLALVKPNLTFHFNSPGWTRGANNGVEGMKYALRYEVRDNDEPCGVVSLDMRYHRGRSSETVYEFRSHLIEASGGRRRNSAVRTADISRAMTLAKKYLRAPTSGYKLHEKFTEAYRCAGGIIHDLMRPIIRGNFLTSVGNAQILLNAYMTGRPVPTAADSAMRAKLVSPAFDAALAEFQLAAWFDVLPSEEKLFVYRHGNSCSFFSGDVPSNEQEASTSPVTTLDFEDLPAAWQERLGVLQLMKDSELVLDVGLRIAEDSFFIKR